MNDVQISKVKLKLGPIEVEYEGSEAFLRTELLDLLKNLLEIYKTNYPLQSLPSLQNAEDVLSEASQAVGKIELTTNTIAAKLGCKTGQELVLAACAALVFVKQKDFFARKEIISEMKSASTFYKKTYVDNMRNYLDGLVKDGKLLERSNGVFALPSHMRKEMESKIAR